MKLLSASASHDAVGDTFNSHTLPPSASSKSITGPRFGDVDFAAPMDAEVGRKSCIDRRIAGYPLAEPLDVLTGRLHRRRNKACFLCGTRRTTTSSSMTASISPATTPDIAASTTGDVSGTAPLCGQSGSRRTELLLRAGGFYSGFDRRQSPCLVRRAKRVASRRALAR